MKEYTEFSKGKNRIDNRTIMYSKYIMKWHKKKLVVFIVYKRYTVFF